MAGHSKWAQIKRKKAVTDAKKGAVFTKLGKNIAVAAKRGKDPEMNPALRSAIAQARAANMPKDNIEKAILKGAGELPGVVYEEVIYEAYGPGGAALVIECVTDNTNRTVSNVRALLTKHGATLGNSGSVLYMFEQKGVIRLAAETLAGQDREALELQLIDAGADDIQSAEEGMTITTAREQLNGVLAALETAGLEPASSGLEWVTPNTIPLSDGEAKKLEAIMEALEEDDDVVTVSTNADL
jgi:YebC/PmpR family DNA-binding regulatory protein